MGEVNRAGSSHLGVGGDVLEAEAEPGAAREQRAQLLQSSVLLTCRQSRPAAEAPSMVERAGKAVTCPHVVRHFSLQVAYAVTAPHAVLH